VFPTPPVFPDMTFLLKIISKVMLHSINIKNALSRDLSDIYAGEVFAS